MATQKPNLNTLRKLTNLDVLEYALDGACNYRGLHSGALAELESAQIDADIKNLEMRVKLARQSAAMKDLKR